MRQSSEFNEVLNQNYADVLTANFDNFQFSNPVQHELTQPEVDRLDILMTNVYGRPDYLDLVLDLNRVGHRMELTPGSTIFLPVKADLDRFILRRRKNNDS